MAEFLSEEEQLAQLKGWWSRYGWWLVAGVVLGLGGYFFLQHREDSRAQTNAAASEVFERYQEYASDEAKAAPLLARLDGEFAGSAYQIMSLMTRAQLATEASDVETAIGFYQTASDAPNVLYFSDVARLRLARALAQAERSDEALAALGKVSGVGYRSLVAELKGDILRSQGDTEKAREAYAAAVSELVDNPRPLLNMKLADLSAPEGAVAEDDVTTIESKTMSDTEGGTEDGTEGDSGLEVVESDEVVESIGNDAADVVSELVGDSSVEDAIDLEVIESEITDLQVTEPQ